MTNFLTYDFIAQAIGILASAVVIFSFTQKIDNRLKAILMIGNLIFMVHFLMLGAYAGMIANIINVCRVGCSITFHKSTKFMLFFMSAYIAMGYFIYDDWYDLLPVLSGLLGTFSMFKLSGIKMRLTGFIGSSAWLGYAIIFNSIGGIITEVANLSLNGITILRMMRDKKKQNEQNT